MAADSTISIEIELQKALRKLEELQKAFDKQNELINQASRAASRFERVIKTSMASATKAVKGALSVFFSLKSAAVGIVAAFSAREFVNFGANYERQISRLNALTRATETEQLRLRKAIREVGSTTAFTATQAAEAANVLAALGRSSNQIAKELGIVVKVAGATGTAIETVSEAVAAQMNVFGESAEQVGNIFAAAFSTSAANVEKLQTALGQVGPVAKSAGLDLTQTAGAISFLVDRGFRAEAAGTALRGVLVRLIDPTKNVLKEFDKLGVSFEEIQQLSFQDQMQKIADQLSNVASQAERNRILTTIFGVEALAAANNFITALSEGNRVIDTQAQKLREATDAATLYNKITSDLRGAVDGLIAAVQEKLLAAFQAVEPLIKEIVNDLTEAVSSITTPDIINTMADIASFLVRGATGFYNTILSAISSLFAFFRDPAFQRLIEVSEAALESLGFRSLDQQIADAQQNANQAALNFMQASQNPISVSPFSDQTTLDVAANELKIANEILGKLKAKRIETETIFGINLEDLKVNSDYLTIIEEMRDASIKRHEAMEDITTEINEQTTATNRLADAEKNVPSIQKEILAIKVRLKELDLEERKYFDDILEKAQLQVDAENTILGIIQEITPEVEEQRELLEETNEIEKKRKKNQEELSRLQRLDVFDGILNAIKKILGFEKKITGETEKQLSNVEKQAKEREKYVNTVGDTLVEGVAGAGPNASRGLQVGQAFAAGGGGITGLINASAAAVMSNEKVQKAIDENFRILFDFIDPLIEILADLQIAINRLIAAFLQGVNNAVDSFSNILNTITFGLSDYLFGGGITRDFESLFGIGGGGPRGNVQTGINAAFANADQIFTDIRKDAVGDRDEIQSIVNSLTPLLDTLSLEELIDRIGTRTTEAIDELNKSVQPLFDALAASGGNPAIMANLQKQIVPIMNEIKNIQKNTDLVITGLVEAFASQPIGVLEGMAGSAEGQIRSIENQSKSQRELIEVRYAESLIIIDQQMQLARLIEDQELRNQLLDAASKAEKKIFELREKQIEQLEREGVLLQVQDTRSTLQSILDNFESVMLGISELVEGIFDQVTDLLMSEFNLAPAQQKLEIASENYGDLLAAALDPEATEENIKDFQEFVNEYLRAARDVYKSSSTFQAIFTSVLNDLTALGVASGFNLTTGAVSGATSEIQDFIDATADLNEELSTVLTGVIADLKEIGRVFSGQLLEFVYSPSGMGIPIMLEDGSFAPNLTEQISLTLTAEQVNEAIQIIDENGEPLKLDFTATASFTENITGFYSLDPETYPDATRLEEAHFSESITGFEDYSGTATFTDTITGFGNYSATASFTNTITGWGSFSGAAIFSNSFSGDWTSTSTNSAFANINAAINLDSSLATNPINTLKNAMISAFGNVSNAINAPDGIIQRIYEDTERIAQAFKILSSYSIPSPISILAESSSTIIRAGQDTGKTGGFVGGGSVSDQNLKDIFGNATAGFNFGGDIVGFDLSDIANTFVQSGKKLSPYAVYMNIETPFNLGGGLGGPGLGTVYLPEMRLLSFESLANAQAYYDSQMARLEGGSIRGLVTKLGFRRGGYVNPEYSLRRGGYVHPQDTIPAMLSAGEFIMSPETVSRFGVHTLNRINSGDSAALTATSDPDVKRLLAELILAVRESETEVNVYTDMKGEAQAAVSEFRSELKERTRRQGETYVPAKYI